MLQDSAHQSVHTACRMICVCGGAVHAGWVGVRPRGSCLSCRPPPPPVPHPRAQTLRLERRAMACCGVLQAPRCSCAAARGLLAATPRRLRPRGAPGALPGRAPEQPLAAHGALPAVAPEQPALELLAGSLRLLLSRLLLLFSSCMRLPFPGGCFTLFPSAACSAAPPGAAGRLFGGTSFLFVFAQQIAVQFFRLP